MSDTFRTERLVFRRFQHSDAARLVALVDDIEIARWIGTMPHPYTLQAAQDYLDHVNGSAENTYALEYQGKLAGAVSLDGMLGFWLARTHWGQGLITEAATEMVARHFASDTTAVRSAYHDGNAASARVHAKLGFKAAGTSMVYAQALGKNVLRHDLILSVRDWRAQARA